jgi:phosphatidylinositol-3-phosphatase
MGRLGRRAKVGNPGRAALSMVLLALGAAACTSVQGPKTTATTATTGTVPTVPDTGRTTTTVPVVPHIMVVMMENKSFSQVIGQSDQPYTNSLADSYGLATKSYAFGHPSLPNYLDIVSGSSQGVTDDNPPSSHEFPGSPTLADQLVAAGYSAHAYAENLPLDPTVSAGNYAVRHVPWEYFPHARISVSDASALIPDLNGSNAPDFVWYTPNLIDDEHNGTVEQGDAFLSTFVPEVQSTAWYRAGGEIIIEWDESDGDDSGIDGSGGGHIPTIVVSEALKSDPEQDPTPVDTAGILHSIENAYGRSFLGAAGDTANGNIDDLLDPGGHPRP